MKGKEGREMAREAGREKGLACRTEVGGSNFERGKKNG